jgi:hypothetical protein
MDIISFIPLISSLLLFLSRSSYIILYDAFIRIFYNGIKGYDNEDPFSEKFMGLYALISSECI